MLLNLKMLAIAALGAIALSGVTYLVGRHDGAAAEREELARRDAAAMVKAIRDTAKATAEILTVGRDLAGALTQTRERTRVIVREVTREVEADAALRAAVLPPRTRELRREQVDASRRIAEGRAVRPAGD